MTDIHTSHLSILRKKEQILFLRSCVKSIVDPRSTVLHLSACIQPSICRNYCIIKQKKVNLIDLRSRFNFMHNYYSHSQWDSVFLPCKSYRLSNVFEHVKTYRNTTNHLLAYEYSHVSQFYWTALRNCHKIPEISKTSVKCLSVQVYTSLSLKILLAMENTELRT